MPLSFHTSSSASGDLVSLRHLQSDLGLLALSLSSPRLLQVQPPLFEAYLCRLKLISRCLQSPNHTCVDTPSFRVYHTPSFACACARGLPAPSSKMCGLLMLLNFRAATFSAGFPLHVRQPTPSLLKLSHLSQVSSWSIHQSRSLTSARALPCTRLLYPSLHAQRPLQPPPSSPFALALSRFPFVTIW